MHEKLTFEQINNLKHLIKQVRINILKMIHNAKSGHTGGSLSCAEILTVLYHEVMNHCPKWDKDPNFAKRDRFVLSKGHSSAALYAVLANCGYFPQDELMTFRKLKSRLQGHPCARRLAGVEVSTGSLGQGLSIGCGMALGLRLDNLDSHVFILLGDGELQEGNVWEAAMNISQQRLSNITAIVDRNRLQIDGCTKNVKSLEPLDKKFEAFGWSVLKIDGHDIEQIYEALLKAKSMPGAVVIIADTFKGKGVSFMEDVVGWHGKSPNDDELARALAELEER